MIKGGLFFLLLAFLSMPLRAQGPILSSNPGNVRWNQVITPSFQVIFPQDNEAGAQRVANLLESLKEKEAATMSESLPRRIPIILNQYQSVSNAFVSMGPWRSEFNMMPSPRPDLLGTNQWDELIASHEYRHVVQFHHSRRGFNRLLYYIFGQQTQAGMAFVSVPRWFWEGDATLTETLYTPGGRGRIPAFGRVFRANLMEGKRYNYNKQHLQSYKDFVPDHYKLGYYFVAHIRRKTRDPEIWEKVTADAFAWSPVPFTFSNALKKHTGEHLVQSYDRMMDDLWLFWEREFGGLKYTDPEDLNRRKETTFTNYMYPQQLADGRIVAMMEGQGDIRQLVTFDEDGYPRKLFIPGIVNDAGMLSVKGSKIVFNEYGFDPRWRNRTYSEIKVYDAATGRVSKLSRRGRFIGGDLSFDEKRIITSENTTDQSNRLVIIDAHTGERIRTIPSPTNGLYLMPRWIEEDRGIVAVRLDTDGKKLVYYDLAANREQVIWDAAYENIAHPVYSDSVIYYNSPRTGIDNIHALDLRSEKHYQVTRSRYGAYNPAVSNDGTMLYYNEHRLNGMDVVHIPIDPTFWTLLGDTVQQPQKYFEPILDQEGEDLVSDVPGKSYPVKRYSKAAHMFNIHSWGPLASTTLNSIEVGIASRDVLSTTSLSAGYTYDLAEESGSFNAQFSYQDLYPILDFRVEHGDRRSDRGTLGSEFGEERDIIFTWKETSFYGGIRLPFLLTDSKMVSEFTISNMVGLTQVSSFNNAEAFIDPRDSTVYPRIIPVRSQRGDSLAYFYEDELADGNLISNNLSFTYYALMKQSQRDINSRWGVVLNGRWLSTPFGGDFNAQTLAARAILYMPSPLQLTGLPAFKHHSLYFMGGWQSSDTDYRPDLYVFRNQIPRPRGYSYPLYPDFIYGGVNYTMPIFYPDLSIGPFLFIKRLRTNMFFDYGRGKVRYYYYDIKNYQPLVSSLQKETYRSAGIEAMVDLNVMRFAQEIGIGVRYSHLLGYNSQSFDLLLNIDF